MNMLRVPLLLALTFLLSSCAVSVRPAASIDVHSVGVSDTQTLNSRLDVRGYPGATVIKQEEKESSSKTTFETGASLAEVYTHFHGQLSARGWRRQELDSKPNQVKAEYARSGEELELKLNREGRSGRYKLELKLDD